MTQDETYINLANNILRKLQEKYQLKLSIRNNVLNYSNGDCNFSLNLEKHFEFFICFHLNKIDLRLYDVVVGLDFPSSDVLLVTKNQFANERGAMFVLENLLIVLEKILNMLQKKPNLLLECLEIQKHRNENALLEVNLSLIQQAWEEKKYDRFLRLVETNRIAIKNSKKAKKVFKQEAYIKKWDKGTEMLSPLEKSNNP